MERIFFPGHPQFAFTSFGDCYRQVKKGTMVRFIKNDLSKISKQNLGMFKSKQYRIVKEPERKLRISEAFTYAQFMIRIKKWQGSERPLQIKVTVIQIT